MNYALLKNNPLFLGLSEDEIASFFQCVSPKIVKKQKGEFLLRTGEVNKNLGILLSGEALVIQEDLWGRRSIMAKLSMGDIYGETFAASNGVPMNVSLVAENDVEAILLPMELALKTCPHSCDFHSKVICNLVTIMARKVLMCNNKITHMSKRTTKEKLLSYLSTESQRQGSLSFDIPFDRQELADYLCVERAAMSAVISELKKEGYISCDKKHFTLYVTE